MPEVGRLVVVNTTPIIALSAIDRLGILRLLYTEDCRSDEEWR